MSSLDEIELTESPPHRFSLLKNDRSNFFLECVTSLIKLGSVLIIASTTNNIVTCRNEIQKEGVNGNSKDKFGDLLLIIISLLVGVILVSLWVWIMRTGLEKIYKMKILNEADKANVGDDLSEIMLLTGCVLIKDFDLERIMQLLRKVFFRNTKLRSQLRYWFLNFWWVEVDYSEDRFNELVTVDYTKKNFEEVISEARKKVNDRLDLSKQGIQVTVYSFSDSNYKSGKSMGALVCRCDHCFSDGLGFVSLLYLMDENLSNDHFPKSIKQIDRNFSITNKLVKFAFVFKNLIEFIIFGWIKAIKLTIRRQHSTVFNKPHTGLASVSTPLTIPLNQIKSLSKTLGMTINELLMVIISKSLNTIDPYVNSYTLAIPIGNTAPVFSIENAPLRNSNSAITFGLPLINDLRNKGQLDNVLLELRGLVTSIVIKNFLKYLAWVICETLPTYLYKRIVFDTTKKSIDFSVSNMPGPCRKLLYGKEKKKCNDGLNENVVEDVNLLPMQVEKIVPFCSSGSFRGFASVFSYLEEIIVIPIFDASQGVDPERFKDIISDVIRELELIWLKERDI